MIRKLLVCAAFAASVFSAYSQDYSFGSEYGFTYSTNGITNNYTWTNDNVYPFTISAMTFNSDVANTTTVTRIRPVKEYQVVGNVVATNDMGGVETNYSYTVTNTVTVLLTNSLLSTTNSGTDIYDTSDIPQMYFRAGDIIVWSFSDNTEKVLQFDALR